MRMMIKNESIKFAYSPDWIRFEFNDGSVMTCDVNGITDSEPDSLYFYFKGDIAKWEFVDNNGDVVDYSEVDGANLTMKEWKDYFSTAEEIIVGLFPFKSSGEYYDKAVELLEHMDEVKADAFFEFYEDGEFSDYSENVYITTEHLI